MDISNNDETEPQKKSEITLTKKQIKKKKKEERWEEIKKLKKLKMKEKKLLAKSIIDKKEPTQEISSEKPNLLVKQHRFNKTDKKEYRLAVQTSHPIIIDCSFQPLMTEKEIKSLCVQLAYCHSINRKFPIRSQIVITSFTDQIKQKLAKTNAENWGVSLQEKHYLEYYDKSKLIYLTGDAEEELNELEKEYIFNLSYNL